MPIRPSYRAAGAAACALFALYVATLLPSTAMWDTSEYLTAAHVLGIPHPPGNPFFVLIGHVFSLLPVAPTIAQRVNLMAALTSALSAGAWFLVTERVLAHWLPKPWQRLAGATVAVLVGGTAFTVWSQSVVNEKVYTVSLLFFAIVAWLVILWSDDPDAPGAERLLVLSVFLIALGYTNHPAGFLVAPAVAVAILARRARLLVDPRFLGKCAAVFALGLTPFLFEPIRAGNLPALNEGETTACTTHFAWNCTLTPETWDRFRDQVTRKQYGGHELVERQAPFTGQIAMYWMYFKWQWMRDVTGAHPGLQSGLAALFLMLALLGGYAHWRHDRASFWFFGSLVFTVTLALVYYLNFKYGYSQDPSLGEREVRDRDYFYLWSFSAMSVWIALGLVTLWETCATLRVARSPVGWTDLGSAQILGAGRRWLAASPVLLLAGVPFVANFHAAPRAEQVVTRDVAIDLLNSVEPYGILVTGGDNDLFPLWYAQEVEGVRRDVLCVTTSLLGTEWYAGQLLRRPVYPYDAAHGPAAYRGRLWPKPTRPLFTMSLADTRHVPDFVPLAQAVTFHKPGTALVATVDPKRLPFGGLTRANVFVLHMIADGSERPVYISTTYGNYGSTLGLDSHLLTQGFARKVVDDTPVATRDTVMVPSDGWMDTSRSNALWREARGPATIVRHTGWSDPASVGMPLLYVFRGYALAEALSVRHEPGDDQQVNAVMQQLHGMANALGANDLFSPRASSR